MARSLTVKHEENVPTSPLFTGFLLLAMAWMMLGVVLGGGEATPGVETAQAAELP